MNTLHGDGQRKFAVRLVYQGQSVRKLLCILDVEKLYSLAERRCTLTLLRACEVRLW